MNVENEINNHDPITINDISCVHFDLDFEDAISELPECIICRLTDLEDYYEDLSKNSFCPCNFYFHPSCYEEWAQYKKSNKCLICNKDISSNYYIKPPDVDIDEPMVLSYRERQLLRRQQILHREVSYWDSGFNIICCIHPVYGRNPYITTVLLEENSTLLMT